MKVSDVISRVRGISGDRDALQFTDDQLVDWVNDGIRECALQNSLLQKRASQTAEADVAEYSLPSDILRIHSISYDGNKLRFITLQEFQDYGGNVEEDTNAGFPSVCYVWAGNLTLSPAPSDPHTLVVDYIYTPILITTDNLSEELPLPVGYHSRIVDYCLAQVAQQDDDIERYNSKMMEFRTGVQELKDQPESTYDLYPSISVSPRDTGLGTDWD